MSFLSTVFSSARKKQGGIGADEQVVLNDSAKLLNVDGQKLRG